MHGSPQQGAFMTQHVHKRRFALQRCSTSARGGASVRLTVLAALLLATLGGGGCGCISPMDIPALIVTRKLNKVEHVYRLSMEQAVRQVTQAVGDRGGYVRYGTIQGNSRTLYARDRKDDTITIYLSVLPQNPSLVRITIVYELMGDPVRSADLFRAIRSTPVE